MVVAKQGCVDGHAGLQKLFVRGKSGLNGIAHRFHTSNRSIFREY
ncbi:hypothetical protein BRPE64_ACDS27570 [Caballeronia insecticola]|uniref:Uncharacterized protein n=1 Tax=Caballeronia insecticola TaxID=758793 RepID=R4WYU2_9BURK|nr:hypothetical protein BRPE64_ACDS27570 [Caballeronia insecticola]